MIARLRRPALMTASLALGLAGLAVVATGDGTPPARVDLRAGGAWVGSSVGLLTLIDGDSGEVVARVDVGEPSAALVATQHGPVGYAVDGARGTAVRVDPRTFDTGDVTEVLDSPSGQVSVHASRRGSTCSTPSRAGWWWPDRTTCRSATAPPSRWPRPSDRAWSTAGDGCGCSAAPRATSCGSTGAERHQRAGVVDDPAGASSSSPTACRSWSTGPPAGCGASRRRWLLRRRLRGRAGG